VEGVGGVDAAITKINSGARRCVHRAANRYSSDVHRLLLVRAHLPPASAGPPFFPFYCPSPPHGAPPTKSTAYVGYRSHRAPNHPSPALFSSLLFHSLFARFAPPQASRSVFFLGFSRPESIGRKQSVHCRVITRVLRDSGIKHG
jgi:hypothetical protein